MIPLRFRQANNDADWALWIADGKAAVAKMLADPEGKPVIDDALYKRQRDRLLEASWGKCAYCELPLAAGQRKGDVEHYRPKARVRRLDGKPVKIVRDGATVAHPGYFWLAYDPQNLLPSCAACNRRAGDATSGRLTGKSDLFPTLDDVWATTPEELADEHPALLNPWLDSDDPALHLRFDPDTGLVIGISERGRITIDILGLNRDGLPEARRQACLLVSRAVAMIVHAAQLPSGPADADLDFVRAVREGSAPFAAICRVAYAAAKKRILDALDGP